MSCLGSIYALCDPDTYEVRYVGQTRGRVEQRVQGHVACARFGRLRNRVSRWIWSLPCEPAHRVLETDVPLEELDSREAYWVRQFGPQLVNGPATRAVKLSA